MKRQRLILAILVGILVLALAYAFLATPRQQRAPASGPPARPQAGAGRAPAAVSAGGERLQLDLLEREVAAFEEPRRDIFNAWDVAPPPPPPAPPVVKAPAPPPPPPPMVPVAAAPPPRQLALFDFLGFLEKDGEKTFFLAQNNELFVVRQGDRFGGKKEFLVTGVSSSSLTIEQQGVAGVITVSIGEDATGPTSFRASGGGAPAAGRAMPSRGFAPIPRPVPVPVMQESPGGEEAFEQPPGEEDAPAEEGAQVPTPAPQPVLPPAVPQQERESGILQPLPANPAVRPFGE